MLLIIFVYIVCYLLVALVVGIMAAVKIDKAGMKVENRTRYRRKTFDDGLGKYTVNIKEEEMVVVPKEQNNRRT